MYDPILGRFNSVDPLADQQLQFNPYHYSYNNPILFNDPSGLIGELYYEANGNIYYLGDDGQDDGKQYLVNDLSAFSSAKRDNGGLNSGATTALLESGGAKEITVDLPDGQSEGEFFKALYDKGMASDVSGLKEQSASLILNTETATLTASVDSDAGNTPTLSVGRTPDEISGANSNNVMVGRAHTHQLADFIMSETVGDRPMVSTASFHTGDRTGTARLGVPQYSFDSRFIQQQVPTTSMGQPATNSVNGPATSSLYNGTFSILRNTLKTVSVDQSGR